MKKLFLYFFTPFLAAWFVIVPGTALALIPLIPGVVPLATYLGATGTLATAIDYSLVLHAGILAIALNRDTGAANSSTSSSLTVNLSPTNPLPTPAGWAAPVAPSTQPTPPTTADVISLPGDTSQYNCTSQFQTYYNAGTSCTQRGQPCWELQDLSMVTTNPVGYNHTCYGALYADDVHNQYAFNVAATQTSSGGGGTSCPAGYTLSSGSCTLSNAPAVQRPANNNCQIVRVGNSYSAPDNDPDCATTTPTMAGATVSSNMVTMTRADGSVATIVVNPDGTTTATESYPDLPNSKTNTLTTQYSAPAPGTGAVSLTGMSTASTPGVGSSAGSAPGDGKFPTDYNREFTQQTISNTLTDIKTGAGIVQPTEKPQLETAMTKLEEVKDSITSVSTGESPVGPVSVFNPFVPASCSVIGFNFKGHQISYDICPHVPQIQTILGASLYVITGGILFGMFTRRPTGGDS